MMTSLYYYDQKPSGFYFLLQIRAFNIYIFFIRENIRENKAYFKTNRQFSNVCEKERRYNYKEFTFLTSLTSSSFLHTVTFVI